MIGETIIHHGDSRDVLKTLADNSIDSVVTDPPYALISTLKRFGNSPRTEASMPTAGPYMRASAGFMGQKWDTGETAFDPEFWAEVLRVLKPGGHLAAFSGTRTYHRMTCAIEDAGFEIRDQLAWVYGSGFPKSHNQKGDWAGWGTALKPAWEPICLARKPLEGTVAANVLEHGVGALNIDGCRVGNDFLPMVKAGQARLGTFEHAHMVTQERIGRWPSNIVHDGSDEVIAAFPGTAASSDRPRHNGEFKSVAKGADAAHTTYGHSDSGGSAARFFYSAKADADDRLGSKHPTVKPVDLMQWLCRLITPPGGTVLDPFAGSGTTGQAAMWEGFNAILIERDATFYEDIKERIAYARLDGVNKANLISRKATPQDDLGPLLSGFPIIVVHDD